MHNESLAERKPDPIETEQPKRESWIQRNGHVVFWGSIVTMTVANTVSSYFGYRHSVNELEIARIHGRVSDLAELAMQNTQQ